MFTSVMSIYDNIRVENTIYAKLISVCFTVNKYYYRCTQSCTMPLRGLTIVYDRGGGTPISFVRFWRPPLPQTRQYFTILMTGRGGGAPIFCKKLNISEYCDQVRQTRPNSGGGCRGPSKIRQRGGCKFFFTFYALKIELFKSFYAKRLKKAYF